MKKSIIFLLLFSLTALFGNAQQGVDEAKEKYLKKREALVHPNVIKINSFALAFSNVSLSYERALHPRWSAGIGVGYKYAGGEPGFFNVDNPKIDLYMDAITGFSIIPEARWYARKCDNSLLDGFYLGLYLKFLRYNTSLNFDYFPENDAPEQYSSSLEVGELGIGLQLGYQILLWKRLSIDFLIMGPRYSNYHFVYEFEQLPTQEFLDDISDHLNTIIDRFGLDYTVELKQSAETRASHSFSFANVRIGLALGFAF